MIPPANATLRIPSWSAAIEEIIDMKNVVKRLMEAIMAAKQK